MIKPSRQLIGGLGVSAALMVAVLQHEGYRDTAYIPVPGDVPTIGAGRTKGVRMGDKTEPVREMVYLLNDLEGVYAAGVKRCVTVPLYQHEFDAYMSLSYNIGVGAFCNSTLVRHLNESDYEGACSEIKRWNRQGGRVLPGLIKRREAEYRQCMGLA